MIIGYVVHPHGTLDSEWDVPKCTEGGDEVASWKVFAIVGSEQFTPIKGHTTANRHPSRKNGSK